MDTDDLTEDAYEAIRIARQGSPLIGAQLAVCGSRVQTEDDFLRAMVAHLHDILEDPREEADWLDGELSERELASLCLKVKRHIERTLSTPIADRGKPPFDE